MLSIRHLLPRRAPSNVYPPTRRFPLRQVFFEQIDGHPTVTGCKLVPYLLEKGRVSAQSHNERNYHVFYGLLAHAESCKKYGLGSVKDYFYLNRFKYSGKSSDKDLLRVEASRPEYPIPECLVCQPQPYP